MRLGLRLLLGYFLIVAVAGYFVLNIFMQEVKPGVRRAAEGTLNDTANLLAQFAYADITQGRVANGQLANAFARLNKRPIGANIAGIRKNRNEYRVYLTDAAGKVIFDSSGEALGKDYSQWNDVWLTLRGRYGARSSRTDPNDDDSAVMYVAAPVYNGDKIIGVLSVGKPNLAMAPVIKRSERRIQIAGVWLLGIALVIGMGFVWWINRSISRLVNYAGQVADGEPAVLPAIDSIELRRLAQALESMRLKLEGKAYIEQYVHTLTHELKSPLAAIRGAAEILQENPPPEAARRFSHNIQQQSQRIQQLIDKMLVQARLESRADAETAALDIAALLHQVVADKEAQAVTRKVRLRLVHAEDCLLHGDALLVTQAVSNLIDNALDFTPEQGEITVSGEQQGERYAISVTDNGSGIPDFAQTRIFERFYSLPRANGQKSSGLGLSFVREVARLHQGNIALHNHPPQGAQAVLTLKTG